MKPYHVGILFVHGIQGNPKQFDFLTESIPNDVLCRNILLPGHGATTKEFRKAAAQEWLDAVRNAALSMSRRCERIVFVGHSMGCLLGLLTQQELKPVSAMLLICCPLHVRPTWRYFTNSLSANLTKGRTDDPFVKAAWEANGVSAEHAVSYLFCAKPYRELFRLIRNVKKETLTLPDETVFCFSQLDEIVGKQSVGYARDILGAKVKMMSGCGHNYFTPAAQDELIGILSAMINK